MEAADNSLAWVRPTGDHRPTSQVEWPTVVLIVAFHAAVVALAINDGRLAWPLAIALFAILGCFHMSLQHEVLHGHPTPWQRLNEAFVALPAVLWLPYGVYRDSHRLHHRVELTVPGIDPESYYVSPTTWERSGPLYRAALTANRTVLGRLTIWPAIAIVRTVRTYAAGVLRDGAARRMWLGHVVAAVLTCWLIIGVADTRWWVFLAGYFYGGLALTKLRSFAEHLWLPEGTRSAVVKANPLMALLYLNNNLHHTHHALPDAAWYRLPELHRDLGSDQIAASGAGLYRGYGEVIRRHLIRPFSQPIHPGVQHTTSA